MSWVTIIWSMVATACLTLAGIHLLIWSRKRSRWSSLAYALAAIAVAGIAITELQLMHARTPEDVVAAIHLANVALLVMVASLVGFVRCSYGVGNLWIGGAAIGLRIIGLVLLAGIDRRPEFGADTTLPGIEFLGESVTVVSATLVNPWWVLNGLSTLFFLVFVIEASIRLWRLDKPGGRRRAVLTGGSIAGFFIIATVISALINRGAIELPYLISLPFLLTIFAVAYDLTRDVIRGLGRGVDAPMLVILLGAIGGMITSGIVGLFTGAIVLALGYKLMQAWILAGEPVEDERVAEPE